MERVLDIYYPYSISDIISEYGKQLTYILSVTNPNRISVSTQVMYIGNAKDIEEWLDKEYEIEIDIEDLVNNHVELDLNKNGIKKYNLDFLNYETK